MATNRATAYSYQRFSTPDQMKGDSLRRQTEAATAYAEAHGLNLDTDLTFHDLGISAFRGANVNDGALGQFIAAADSGKIAPGSFLLVESLDRLSRAEPLVALNRLADLVGRGIRVITLDDGQEHNAESLTRLDGLIVPLVKASLAHEESAKKSKRGRAAWTQKKKRAAANGEILTARVPAWLRVRDGKMETDMRRAKIVRRIFDLSAAGHGKAAIARQFNEGKVATFGTADGWHASYIQKILRNEAVIGTYQPHRNTYVDGKRKRAPEGDPIENYFPAVVEPSLFYQVKHSKPGPSGKGDHLQRNLLSGLVFCARCDGRMNYANKGRGHVYLICDNARRKRTCDAPAVPYFPTFSYVLAHLDEFRRYDPDGTATHERDREL
ncbi:MAG: recombinase family protein, partial [Proteobacteria bacterium]|nr:recombinase family protein [Pseudomonadota bacterium]